MRPQIQTNTLVRGSEVNLFKQRLTGQQAGGLGVMNSAADNNYLVCETGV